MLQCPGTHRISPTRSGCISWAKAHRDRGEPDDLLCWSNSVTDGQSLCSILYPVAWQFVFLCFSFVLKKVEKNNLFFNYLIIKRLRISKFKYFLWIIIAIYWKSLCFLWQIWHSTKIFFSRVEQKICYICYNWGKIAQNALYKGDSACNKVCYMGKIL